MTPMTCTTGLKGTHATGGTVYLRGALPWGRHPRAMSLAQGGRGHGRMSRRSLAHITLPMESVVRLLVEQALVALGVQRVLDRLGHEAPADPRVALVAGEVDRRQRQRLAVRARRVGDPREDAALADRRLAGADLLADRRLLGRRLLGDRLRLR